MYTALNRNNVELATYQWEKIRTTIENGMMKRPKRAKNAQSLFLEKVWPDVLTDLKSGDLVKAKQGFNKAKTACMSCHAAEQVGFMNNQPVFDLLFK
jgi:cytochrome c553